MASGANEEIVAAPRRASHAAGLRLRRATAADAERVGGICHEAFRDVAARHGFPDDAPDEIAARELASDLIDRDDVYAVVATLDGEVVGSNYLWEFSDVAAAGPLTVATSRQAGGIGRRLMEDVLDRACARNVTAVRLVQAGYYAASMALYLKLGFEICEPLMLVQGPPVNVLIPGHTVRAGRVGDVTACVGLCRHVHGHDRRAEVLRAVAKRTLKVVEHGGRVSGYSTGVGFFGHTVGECNADVEALIGAAAGFAGPGFLVPLGNARLLRWCLDHGLALVQPMNLVGIGLYKTPSGAALPSILY